MAEISSYLISEASEDVAHRIVSDIAARINEIQDFPDAGAQRDYILPNVRAVFKHGYAAYYQTTPREIVVLGILHGSRDVESVVAEGGFDT